MAGPILLSTNGWRKYSLVGRSQNLYSMSPTDDDGVLVLPSERPSSSRARMREERVRALSYRTLQMQNSNLGQYTSNRGVPETGTLTRRPPPSRSTSFQMTPSLPPPPPVRRRIPLELFESLPESKIDPEPVKDMQPILSEEDMAITYNGNDHRAVTLTVRSPSPDAVSCASVEQTLLCQESQEGTLFGLVRTPTPVRKTQRGPFQTSETFRINQIAERAGQVQSKGGITVVDIRSRAPIDYGDPRNKINECFNRSCARDLPFGGHVLETVNTGLVRAFSINSNMIGTVDLRASNSPSDPGSPWSIRPAAATKRNTPLAALPRPPLRWSSRPVIPTVSNPLPGSGNLGIPFESQGPLSSPSPLHRSWSLQEPEVREAMRQLDLSIQDEVIALPAITVDHLQQNDSGPASVNSAAPRGKDAPDAENDNLIEEVLLSPGSDRRKYHPPSLNSLSQPPSLGSHPSLGETQPVDYNLQEQIELGHLTGLTDEAIRLEDAVVSSERGSPAVSPMTPSGSPEPNKCTTFFVVVAIDFGTTYSGYAFSFVRDPGKVHVMRKWEGGDPGVLNQKTPTCLLLTPEGLFHSFGFAARDFYHNMEPEESQSWLYFEKFKMTLHNSQDLCRETTLTASNGRSLPALTIFAHALRYFREQALRELSDQSGTRILNEDVRWVVTVPAIWRQPAKQFMRTASYQAGLASSENPDHLLIALEPEAASLYCRQLRLHQLVPETPPLYKHYLDRSATLKKEELVPEPPAVDSSSGTRYLVVDCGGGTVDMTLHELLESGNGELRELHKATGGPHGSVAVDAEFERLLDQLFGEEFMVKFKKQRPVAFLDLMVAFEARKRGASPYSALPSNVALPFALIDAYKKSAGHSVESAIKKAAIPGISWSSQGMLRLDPTALQRLFRSTLEGIKESIAGVLAHKNAQGAQYLFLVGGFAESPILQREIRETFSPYVKVIIPQGVSLAILTGAVIFGLDPAVVRVRRSRLTYGVGVLHRFAHGTHPIEKRVVKDGVEWCADVLDPFVLAEQSVALGDAVTRRYTPARPGQARTVLHLYCSERADARYVTDEGVSRCGTLVLELEQPSQQKQETPLPPNIVQKRREIQMRMVLGDTEVKVSALDVTTGQEAKAQIDFLN